MQQLFIGINGHVCAIDSQSGAELWRTRLQEQVFGATRYEDVSVMVAKGVVYAGSQGHLFALDGASGRIIWHNELKGLRFNDISLSMEGISVQYIQKVERQSNSSGSNS